MTECTVTYTGWAKKRGHRLMTIILSNLNRFTKFAVKCILNIRRTLHVLLRYLVKH